MSKIIWFTGMPGAGKTTLAAEVGASLEHAGYRVELLDGDTMRTRLCRGLGFSKEDRVENNRRIGYVARLLARNGVVALVAAVSPYAEARLEQRCLAQLQDIDFYEVFVDCPLLELIARDPKGLYKKASAGEIDNFTGISDPYEVPESPEVTVHTDKETVEESTKKILVAMIRAEL